MPSETRLSREQLLETVRSELMTHLQSGTVNSEDVSASLDIEDLNIDDWGRLKRIHFCLDSDIVQFAQNIETEIRQIKTETQRDQVVLQGEVQGRINWGSTLRHRSQSGYTDRSQYVCETPYTEYDIAENRVLKRLLWQVYRTVDQDIAAINQEWRRNRWNDDDITDFRLFYTRNIHLSRMHAGESIRVSQRDLGTARQSRHQLYRRAARFLSQFRRLDNDELGSEETQRFLLETLVKPSRDATLFELYCGFGLIKQLRTLLPDLALQPIETGDSPFARFASDTMRVEAFHDQTGALTFEEPLERPSGGARSTFLSKYITAMEDFIKVAEALSETSPEPALYRGRPDFVVEFYDQTDLSEIPKIVLLVEVKYSASSQTFRQGVEDLIKYWHFCQTDQRYLSNNPETTVLGLLLTDGAANNGSKPPIYHLSGKELHSKRPSEWVDALSKFFPN